MVNYLINNRKYSSHVIQKTKIKQNSNYDSQSEHTNPRLTNLVFARLIKILRLIIVVPATYFFKGLFHLSPFAEVLVAKYVIRFHLRTFRQKCMRKLLLLAIFPK
jgi:hypothetical protein